jgi:hypothetical protein
MRIAIRNNDIAIYNTCQAIIQHTVSAKNGAVPEAMLAAQSKLALNVPEAMLAAQSKLAAAMYEVTLSVP